MKDFPKLLSARPEGDFRIRARFSDGVCGAADMRSAVFSEGEMSRPLRDPAYFRRFRIGQCGEIVWPNGFDCCPDALYLRIAGISFDEFAGAQRRKPAAQK